MTPLHRSVRGRVLNRLRVAHPESRTKNDLILDRLLAGSPAAIKKTLQRLESQQLIVSCVPEGSRSKEYKSKPRVRRGVEGVPSGTYASVGTVLMGDKTMGTTHLCPPS